MLFVCSAHDIPLTFTLGICMDFRTKPLLDGLFLATAVKEIKGAIPE
jgi:hypothetical protein